MKIRIRDIPPEGQKITGSISLENINSRMNEGAGNDIFFLTAPELLLEITPSRSGAFIHGTAHSTYRQPCSRCVREIDRSIEIQISLALKPMPEGSDPHNLPEEENGTGIAYFTDDIFDIENWIQESLILTLSPFWHPAEDAEGKCSMCGEVPLIKLEDSNTETHSFSEKDISQEGSSKGALLGSLLRAAGIKS